MKAHNSFFFLLLSLVRSISRRRSSNSSLPSSSSSFLRFADWQLLRVVPPFPLVFPLIARLHKVGTLETVPFSSPLSPFPATNRHRRCCNNTPTIAAALIPPRLFQKQGFILSRSPLSPAAEFDLHCLAFQWCGVSAVELHIGMFLMFQTCVNFLKFQCFWISLLSIEERCWESSQFGGCSSWLINSAPSFLSYIKSLNFVFIS